MIPLLERDLGHLRGWLRRASNGPTRVNAGLFVGFSFPRRSPESPTCGSPVTIAAASVPAVVAAPLVVCGWVFGHELSLVAKPPQRPGRCVKLLRSGGGARVGGAHCACASSARSGRLAAVDGNARRSNGAILSGLGQTRCVTPRAATDRSQKGPARPSLSARDEDAGASQRRVREVLPGGNAFPIGVSAAARSAGRRCCRQTK